MINRWTSERAHRLNSEAVGVQEDATIMNNENPPSTSQSSLNPESGFPDATSSEKRSTTSRERSKSLNAESSSPGSGNENNRRKSKSGDEKCIIS